MFVYVVRRMDGPAQLLVFASHDEPGYEVPKGSVEPGETIEQAARRELFEEAGIARVEIVESLGATTYCEEDQRFLLARPSIAIDDEFEHIVSGTDEDAGKRYVFRWLNVDETLSEFLVQGCGAFVEPLRRRA